MAKRQKNKGRNEARTIKPIKARMEQRQSQSESGKRSHNDEKDMGKAAKEEKITTISGEVADASAG